MTNEECIVFQEYENMYINTGKRKFPSIYFQDLPQKQKQELALSIMRFAIENYLHWTPYDVKRYFSKTTLNKLKLNTLLQNYIHFPPEYSKDDEDLTYLAYLLYPSLFRLNSYDQCINMFQRVYNGELSKYPGDWMSSGTGMIRFAIILQYVIRQLPRFQNATALYEYFSSSAGTKLLKKYKIFTYALTIYPTAFDAFHYSMPKEIQSEFLYHYCRFKKKNSRLKL